MLSAARCLTSAGKRPMQANAATALSCYDVAKKFTGADASLLVAK
jgi:hypothetical protein